MQSLASAFVKSTKTPKSPNMESGPDSITNQLVSDIGNNQFSEVSVNEKNDLSVSHTALDPRVALANQMVRGLSEPDLATLIRDVNAMAVSLDKKGNKDKSQQMMSDCLVIVMMARDIDEGKGERMIAYNALLELYKYFPETIMALMPLLPEMYGSWKDVNNLLSMLYDKISSLSSGAFRRNPKLTAYQDLVTCLVKMYAVQLAADESSSNPSLAGKWSPREARNGNTKKMAHAIAKMIFCDKTFNRKDGSIINSWNYNSEALSKDPSNQTLLKNLNESKVACYAAYRKLTSKLNTSTEVLMCDTSNKWSEIKPGSVPAKCLKKHRKGFYNQSNKKGDLNPRSNNPDRVQCAAQFAEYVRKALKDPTKARVHGKKLMPHEIVSHYLRGGDYDEVLEAQWIDMVESLREAGTFNDLLPLVDVSGSMSGTPMEVAIAIGLLVAALSPLANGYFITFESNCRWHKVTGKTLFEKVVSAKSAPWGGSTNFESAMNLVLSTVSKNDLAPEEVDKLRLIVLSDMEFDTANGRGYYDYDQYSRKTTSSWSSSYDKIKVGFEKAGLASSHRKAYSVPEIWFWNLRASSLTFPVKDNIPGAFLISGWSQNALKSMMKGDLRNCKNEAPPTAFDLLRKEMDSDRYDAVRKVVESTQEGHFKGYYMPKAEAEAEAEVEAEVKVDDSKGSSSVSTVVTPPPPSPIPSVDITTGWVDVTDTDESSMIDKLKTEMEKQKLAAEKTVKTLQAENLKLEIHTKQLELEKAQAELEIINLKSGKM